MAAFNPKPWFKQPAGTEVKLKEKPKPYINLFNDNYDDLLQPVDIPQAVAMFDENLNYENISISYELFNDVIIWGLINYPDLHTFFMQESEVHGTKVSFDKDIFKPLSKVHQFLHFKDIKRGSSIYKRLSMSQKYICNLIQDYDKFSLEIKDKYTSICKTKMFDRYGNYSVNHAIITYPGVTDLFETEEKILLKEKRIPFGKFKGIKINEIDKQYIEKFIQFKSFKKNKAIRDVFRNSKFSHLVKKESTYSSTLKSKMKSQSKMKSKGSSKRTKMKSKSKSKKLLYFYMIGCGYCETFNKTWNKLVKKYKHKLTMKKINGPKNSNEIDEYKVTSYPTLILVDGGIKLYNGDRSFEDIETFIN